MKDVEQTDAVERQLRLRYYKAAGSMSYADECARYASSRANKLKKLLNNNVILLKSLRCIRSPFIVYSVIIGFRRCLLAAGCDMVHVDKSLCKFMPHNLIKGVQNIHKVIQKTGKATDQLYILDCSTPQENILSNSDAFTHSNFGE